MADMDDFLSDTAALYGDTMPLDDGMIRYGPLVLTVAPKVCFPITDTQKQTNSRFKGREGV